MGFGVWGFGRESWYAYKFQETMVENGALDAEPLDPTWKVYLPNGLPCPNLEGDQDAVVLGATGLPGTQYTRNS